jgi:hypothetical protein
LSPVEQSRELDPLDSILDFEAQEQTVEIGLDGAFGHVQVTGDFGVVTSLEQQIDDLLLPACQPTELFVHALNLVAAQDKAANSLAASGPSRSGIHDLPFPCNHAAKTACRLLTKCENRGDAVFIRERRGQAYRRDEISTGPQRQPGPAAWQKSPVDAESGE